MSILAAITSGHADAADLCYLIAVILAALAALSMFAPRRPVEGGVLREMGLPWLLGWAAVALIALGLLLL